MNCQGYECSKEDVNEPHTVTTPVDQYCGTQPSNEHQRIERPVENCVEREGALLFPRHDKMVEGKRDKKDPCRVYEPGPLTHEQADERPQGKQPNRDRKAYHNVCLKAPGCLCVLYNLVAEHDSHVFSVFSFLFLFLCFESFKI